MVAYLTGKWDSNFRKYMLNNSRERLMIHATYSQMAEKKIIIWKYSETELATC